MLFNSLRIHQTGLVYVAVGAGPVASYFVRNDGVVERSVHGGKVSTAIEPPAGVKYISASAGMANSYLGRDDGT